MKRAESLHTYVIAGKIKGMKIEFTPGEVRPMTSRVKEALFNIIYDCSGINMLDLFCGSGGISIEGFSRGVERADLVDSDAKKKEVILKNLSKAGFKNCSLYIKDVFSFLSYCNKTYDFIMTDPPFKWDKKEKLLLEISNKKILKEDGFLVIHLPKKEELNEEIGNFIRYDVRNYGLNTLMFYKNKG